MDRLIPLENWSYSSYWYKENTQPINLKSVPENQYKGKHQLPVIVLKIIIPKLNNLQKYHPNQEDRFLPKNEKHISKNTIVSLQKTMKGYKYIFISLNRNICFLVNVHF